MPSGIYNSKLGNCGICGKIMRPLYKNKDWEGRAYHITCFKNIIKDIHNYNEVAYTKYGVEKKGSKYESVRCKKRKIIYYNI